MTRRFAAADPCPVCGGFDQAPRGRGERCFGFLSDDGKYAHCTREDRAVNLPIEADSQTFAHYLAGDCRCGVTHGATVVRAVPRPARIVATFDYTDRSGALQYQVVKYDPKSFRVRRSDGNGGWIWNLRQGVTRVLYNLPEVLAVAAMHWRVYVVEGEKDADAINALGLCATTNVFGAGKWTTEYADALRGAEVVVIADKDEPGRKHAQEVAASCSGKADVVRVVELPGDHVKDVSDWLSAGGTKAELERLAEGVEKSTPLRAQGRLGYSLDETERLLKRFVHFRTDAEAVAVTLWAAHTYVWEHFEQSPILAVTSAVMQSGKTRLLDVLELIVWRPWRVILPSDAVVYRYIAERHPTLMLDEADAIFGRKDGQYEGLRALLNAGNRRGTRVPRVVGQGAKLKVEEFDVHSPKAVVGIGRIPPTVADRAIPIRMERRARSETVEKFRRADVEPIAVTLRTALEQFAVSATFPSHPTMPDELDDRAAESWECPMALADLAGGTWPDRARRAAVVLHANRDQDEEAQSLLLLRDIREVFVGEQMHTQDLLGKLYEIESSPWGDYYGKPMTGQALAKMLRPYRIGPSQVRIGEVSKKGYKAEQFSEAWDRYLVLPAATETPETIPQKQANVSDVSVTHYESDGMLRAARAVFPGLYGLDEVPS